jgi:hypothetical protein
VDAYAILPKAPETGSSYTIFNNIYCQAGVPTKIGIVYFKSELPQTSYTFNIKVPILFYSKINAGTVVYPDPKNPSSPSTTVSLAITDVLFSVQFSDGSVILQNLPQAGAQSVFYSKDTVPFTIANGATFYNPQSIYAITTDFAVQTFTVRAANGFIYDLVTQIDMNLAVDGGQITLGEYGVVFNASSDLAKLSSNYKYIAQ